MFSLKNPFLWSVLPRSCLWIYLVPRATDDGRENSPGGIVPGKARLDQPRAIVAHQCGGFLVVTHLREEARTWKTAGRHVQSPAGSPSAPSRPPSRGARPARRGGSGKFESSREDARRLRGRALNGIRQPLSSPRFKSRPSLQDSQLGRH